MFLFVLEMLRVRTLLESLSPKMYNRKRKRIELAMYIVTPVIVSLGGLQIIAHIAQDEPDFFIIHPILAKYGGLIVAFLKIPSDLYITVLFFTLTTYFVR